MNVIKDLKKIKLVCVYNVTYLEVDVKWNVLKIRIKMKLKEFAKNSIIIQLITII